MKDGGLEFYVRVRNASVSERVTCARGTRSFV